MGICYHNLLEPSRIVFVCYYLSECAQGIVQVDDRGGLAAGISIVASVLSLFRKFSNTLASMIELIKLTSEIISMIKRLCSVMQ